MLLAESGLDVVLVHHEGPARSVREETVIAAGERRLLAHGFDELVAAHAGLARHGRVWGDDELRWTEAPAGVRGLRVERASFDAALRAAAAARGVEVVEGAAHVRAGALLVRAEGREREVTARVVVRATGRAPRGPPVEVGGPQAVALCAELGLAHDEHASAVEAVREGWLWWLPTRRGTVSLALFADADELRTRGAEALWTSALAAARGPASGVDPAAAIAAATAGADATARLGAREGGALLAGDAALSLDPLSSQGLETAFASAEQTAFGVRTLLARPDDTTFVHAAMDSWTRGLFRHHRALTRATYARESRFADAPFWIPRRATAAEARRTEAPLPPRFRTHPDATPTTLAARVGDVLVPRPAVHVPGSTEPLDRIGGVEVKALLALVGDGATLAEASERARQAPALQGCRPSDLAHALLALWRLGFLLA